MIDQELLLELTEGYLKSLISGVSASLSTDFDSFAPFGELGIDSFHVLKIIKKLEADFGTLPKTLLFENFNINDLAHHFIDKHCKTLFAKFSKELQGGHDASVHAAANDQLEPVEVISQKPAQSKVVINHYIGAQRVPVLILEKEAHAHPELGELIRDIFDNHKNESSVSRGTRNIAPNLFIGSEKRGYFNYSRYEKIILAYSYTGPTDYFYILAGEIYQYCVDNNFELNILVDFQVKSIREIPFSATPFGVIQRILNIPDFTLQGSRMRRLRYQVSKFEKAGKCGTEEYHCGANPEIDQNIVKIIDQWCAVRTMVNPLVYTAREEILTGALSRKHRLFLTYIDDVLQNVILISPLCSEQNGYLMDLEFYPQDMPLGGLEFAIVKIIEILVAEGCGMLSLGATLGPKLAPSSNADPEVDKILDSLREQNIFNDEGNLQFKNKFRPDNKTIYLCRAAGSGSADNVTDIIMMIADPAKMQTSDEEHHNFSKISRQYVESIDAEKRQEQPLGFVQEDSAVALEAENHRQPVIEGEARSVDLSDYGYNPLNIPHEKVEFDLKTDSWAELKMPSIDKQMAHLHARLQQPVSLTEGLKEIFPFSYFLLTDSGRTAEALFYQAWAPKGIVLQNLLFPTAIFHQIDKGFTPIEVPYPEVFHFDSNEVFKGNLNWEALIQRVEQDPHSIALVCIEVGDNAAGGYPVSVAHLKKLKPFLAKYSIPLVIDGTRVMENAQFVIEHEKEYADKNIWQVVREILSHADAVIASLTKDFCVDKGGVIATNDPGLFSKLQELIHEQGGGLDVIDKKVIAIALNNRKHIENQVLRRMGSIKLLWGELNKRGIPVVHPAGGHCVLIDVKQIPEFKYFDYPVACFLAWMYLNTGIRAAAHNVGMQKNTAINNVVRLAVPVGLTWEQIEEIAAKLVLLFEKKHNIPEIAMRGKSADLSADIYAQYELKKYHNVSARVIYNAAFTAIADEKGPSDEISVTGLTSSPVEIPSFEEISGRAVKNRKSHQSLDIAIVGMAGRYPKAKSLDELWENLLHGRDCIESIPESRYERRWKNGFIERYRGGFVEDIDRFDSLFFNISPREAEMLDPQERLFLEVAWEAIEDAGYYPEILARENEPRNIGVYVGAVWAMYQMLGVEEKVVGNNTSPNSFLWSIANRVSYWMNFSGPSLTLDTACSSSLTAIYLACEAINKGECSAAIVGGVNLDLHQSKLDINRVGGTQSQDGVCRSFGQGANGYVAGEGVGAIVIKPLWQAVKDRDNIYGVIKSVVINHGGRTSGYSVPSPKAQAELITSALEKAKIDARSIGYVEAHGTGTELGDPIEIVGLTDAFKAYNVNNQTCAIGSIKSNIGHLEAAAGIVSVSKVLLQIKHRRLVPSLHSSVLNEHIDFENSPFYVEQEVEEWQGKEVDGTRYPIRAGISSFGAGGSNAHIILEEYEYQEEQINQSGQQIFPLSARNDDQLREMAIRLRDYVQRDLSQNTPRLRLDNIAYTLQIGRKSFDHRLAIIATTKEQLVELLGSFVKGNRAEEILAGNVKNSQGITRLLSRKEKEEFINLLSQRRDPRKLAQLWIDGLLSDWQGFQAEKMGRRISLPTYPFADKRHWACGIRKATNISLLRSGMHPLIDSNESTFERQLFKKTFNDKEFFIYDHLIADIPTLPGVAYLELARKAGELATGRKVQKIKNIVWVSPLTVKNSVPIRALIDLKPSGDAVHFEVFSEDETGKKQLYSQGKLSFSTKQEEEAEPEFIDIKSIRARCSKVIDGKEAYPLFKTLGLNLGPSFQVLREVFKSENEVLGVLKIPDVRSGDFQDFILHPSLVDGSFQVGMAAAVGDAVLNNKKGEMCVPYSIGEVEVLHPLQPNCYSYVTEGKEDKKGSAKLARSNVLILDEEGKVLVKILESVGVPLADVREKSAQNDDDAERFSKLYYSHVWERSSLDAEIIRRGKPDSILLFDTDETLRNLYRDRLNQVGDDSHDVILVQPGDDFQDLGGRTYRINPKNQKDYVRLFESLCQQKQTIAKICFAWPEPSGRDEENLHDGSALSKLLERGVYSFLFLCQSLAAQKLDNKIQLLYLYLTQKDQAQPHNEAINGFAKTVQLEHPKLSCKVLEIRQENAAVDTILNAVLDEFHPNTLNDMTVRYEEKERYVRKLKKFDLEEIVDTTLPQDSGLKENGVYLITGGAGGLGLIFAEFLAKECKARLVLTGRSELSEEREAKLEKLKELGAEVHYVPADVSKYDDVKRVIKETKSQFGELNGIIHSAGVLRDSYLKNKTPEEMNAVFAPKVYGTLHLDEATKEENLDFFVTFSSMSAVAGNVGQCDYSFANHFMDSFAGKRNYLKAKGQRLGKTLSFNWSIWADGGMKLDEQTEVFFKKNLGIKPLSIETGIEAFRKGIVSTKFQFAVVEGVRDKVEQSWGLREKPPAEAESAKAAALADIGELSTAVAPISRQDADGEILALIQNSLSQTVMEFLKLDADDIDLDKILLDLGFDSIGLATYANAINEKYQLDITPVLFFEYPSIREIAKHLSEEYASAILRVHQSSGASKVSGGIPVAARLATQTSSVDSAQEISFAVKKGWSPDSVDQVASDQIPNRGFSPELRFVNQPIAIVGISGVMPQSEDLDEFWENLKNAQNMVTVIPKDRWNWEDYDGDPLKEENKSNSKWGGFMKEIDKFDPLFFGISPKEAELMDPQQRIFLETVWKAVEDSGQKVSDLSGTKTGLFVGVATNDYRDVLSHNHIPIHAYTSTGNSHSVLVNRVSFLLNLHGPSAPLDTACSSSLIAIHRALESIHTGSCDMAIVGGVQVMLSPAGYIAFGQAGMLSSDGKCKTFDKRANGYVRGEGSGAIFLKPLYAAQADGNHIYAIIKATAENHGGSAAALTAPNPNAQSELLIEAYSKAHIDPTTVGYIECHGTGTSLGDPIEIKALKKSFSELYKKHNKAPAQKPHCGLSSVKSNIGHLETAAGIAGILKALLAIRHKQIPALIHFEELNPYIDLQGTPFYIVDKTTYWEAPLSEDGTVLPRRAGVSSFGFGGANAHVVLEEYISPAGQSPVWIPGPHLIVLSAKNEDRLKAYARSMLTYLSKHAVELHDFAYTLQVGRDAMPERLALVVSTMAELQEKFAAFLQNNGEVNKLYRGNTRNKKGNMQPVPEGRAEQSLVQSLIEQNNFSKLAELWVLGTEINWSSLYTSGFPKRISLPTYPFAKEQYWISVPKEKTTNGKAQRLGESARAAVLHPLVHHNVSTLKEQKFTSRFTGEEFYLADHIVETQKILPGVAYLEMARIAGELSADAPVRFIRDLIWMRPVAVANEPKDIEVSLTPNQHEIEFTVKTFGREFSITNCTGKLAYSGQVPEPEALDLAEIQRRCSEEVITGKELYPELNEKGLKLGKSFQIVQKIYANESESLAVLQLPEHLKKDADQFLLHPALMDGSLHTAVGLMKKSRMEVPLALPYSVGEVQILRPLDDLYYGYATWADNKLKDGESLLGANIQLLDKNGNVLVRIKDFLSRPVMAQPVGQEAARTIQRKEDPVAEGFSIGMECYQSVWKELAASYKEENLSFGNFLIFDQAEVVYDALKERLSNLLTQVPEIILVKMGPTYLEQGRNIYQINPDKPDDYWQLLNSLLGKALLPENILHLWSEKDFTTRQEGLKSSLKKGVFSLFYLSRALMQVLKEREKSQTTAVNGQVKKRKTKLLYVYSSDQQNSQPHHAAIGGFARSIAAENSHFIYKTLEFNNQSSSLTLTPSELLDAVISELQDECSADVEVRYQARKRWVRKLDKLELSLSGDINLKEKGVYLITGGAGGLGLIFAEYLAKQSGARLALTGRSALNPAQKEKIRALESLGAEVEYYQADVSNYEDVERLITNVKSRFNGINGIIHAAGVIRDATILNKTAEEMEAVFAAKIHGTVNLDEATKDESLDFFVLFSSVTAITGNPGQSDYAYANSFMDHFVELRNHLQTDLKRSGKAISFNWPLWREGGMRIDAQMEAIFEKTMGIRALDTGTGLNVFAKGLASNQNRIFVMVGDLQKIRRRLGAGGEDEHGVGDEKIVVTEPMDATAVAQVPIDENGKSNKLLALMKKDLFQLITTTLGIKEEVFSHDVDMIEYGLDSISLSKFFSDINDRYSIDLTPAIFFEYPTFNALSEFLCEEHKVRLADYFKDSLKKVAPYIETAVQVAPVIKPIGAHAELIKHRFANVSGASPITDVFKVSSGEVSIAVVGVGCVMPQSEDIEEFWENLIAGKDLITEIPPDRWDWRAFLGNPVEGNKTNSKWGGFIKDVDKFDAFFFGISPLEAELMDPQQRIFLETVWKAIEDAAHSPSELAGTKTGVFVGVGGHDYLEVLRDNNVDVVAYASTGNTHSVLANRVSYLLDLHGTSEPVDTACSASLVAVHRAVEAITSGSCEMAIAGGVNVMLSPALYLAFGNAGMLSSDGRCKTFDKRADGYVRGEGSGAIFLKKLDQAISDGNHIYGVVKGTGVNHGGHATALTAPNPNAQADLIIDIYRRAKIDPNTVSYIEAHGTGTSLGDPVEINGLKKAFKELNKQNGSGRSESRQAFCAIGSVKTNVGHLETAAGIAGVIKVLLSLKHKKIPANIHFETINPHIRLEGSPFYIVEKTQDWTPLKDEYGRDIPRRAGISSFGFGGANAHIVVEEYIPSIEARKSITVVGQDSNLIVPLSARTAEQLHQKSSDLLDFIRKQKHLKATDLLAMAYTLQVGREAMEERLGFTVSSVEQLADKLRAYIDGEENIEGAYRGQVKRNKEGMSIISQDEDIKETIIDKLIAGKKLSKLLDLWVKGLDLNWDKLYDEVRPPRISLPTYPFAKERCWIGTPAAMQLATSVSKIRTTSSMLHPLLHCNTSDLSQQGYSSIFSGDEFFLKDYQVNVAGRKSASPGMLGSPGQKFLSAVAYLEMARVAVEQGSPVKSELTILELHNIDWLEPFVVKEGKEITIALFENGSEDSPFEQIDYEIYSSEAEQEIIHCQGQAVFIRKPSLERLDIPQLKTQMRNGSLDTTRLYAAFTKIGIDYSTTLQALNAIYQGDNQLLAKLTLPTAAEDRKHKYYLHPSLMDSALYACMALTTDLNQPPNQTSLPNALESLTIVSACTEEMFAWVRYSKGRADKLDVDLVDSKGNRCVLIRGLLLEDSHSETGLASAGELIEDLPEITMMTPRWDVFSSFTEPSSLNADNILIIGVHGSQKEIFEKVYSQSNIISREITSKDSVEVIAKKIEGLVFNKIVWIAPNNPVRTLTEESIIEDQDLGVLQILRIIKSLAALGYEERNMEWNLITFNSQMVKRTDIVNPTHAGLHGFAGSMANEYPRWKIRLIDLQELAEQPIHDLKKLPFSKQGAAYAFRGREWFCQRLIPMKNLSLERSSYRSQGVYVVIGGSGGLGEVWSRHVIEQCQAQVIWIGRREINAEIRKKIDQLSRLGKKPVYIQADASNLQELQAAYRKIKKEYSKIHGIIHSAVSEFDESLRTVKEELFRTILSVKIDISVRIAQVFQKEDLDFILFFSSGASFARSGGMSGYSAGCTFKDTFALQLSKLWPCDVKVINWGYWAVGAGNIMSDSMKALIYQSGQRAIEPGEGMKALELLLSSSFNQIAVIKTLRTNKADIIAQDEWVTSYDSPRFTYRSHKSLLELEDQELPLIFKGAGGNDYEDMEELLYKLLSNILSSTNGIVEFYSRWIKEGKNILTSKGWPIDQVAGRSKKSAAIASLWEEWDQAKEKWLLDETKGAVCVLIEKCMRALPDILTGKQKAIDVIFPNSSLDLVEGFYKSPFSRAYNEILVDTLITAIQARLKEDPSARIKLLEIGVGADVTTTRVIERLKPFQNQIAEYCYTDLSETFLSHAENFYVPQATYLRTQIFDVEKPIAEQNIDAGRYDFVIAANALHATKNIRNTLRNTKAVLHNGGILLLNEISDRSIYTHLIFGLLNGWWLNEDEEIRVPGSPALYPESWREVLREEGFNPVLFPVKEVHKFGQQIVLAVSDGVVRQKQAAGFSKVPKQKNSNAAKVFAQTDLEVEV